jgi:hypothetical protein
MPCNSHFPRLHSLNSVQPAHFSAFFNLDLNARLSTLDYASLHFGLHKEAGTDSSISSRMLCSLEQQYPPSDRRGRPVPSCCEQRRCAWPPFPIRCSEWSHENRRIGGAGATPASYPRVSAAQRNGCERVRTELVHAMSWAHKERAWLDPVLGSCSRVPISMQ